MRKGVKNILIQAVLAVSVAYDRVGFLHGDLHLGNILFKKTKMRTITYSSSNLGEFPIETGGYKVVIMDFEKSAYSSGLLRRPSEYAWLSSATLRIPHSLSDMFVLCFVDVSIGKSTMDLRNEFVVLLL